MEILYVGSFFDKSRSEEIWINSKGALVNSANTFQHALLDGFSINNAPIDFIINAPAIGSFPFRYKNIWFSSSSFCIGEFCGLNCGFLNLTFLKSACVYSAIKKHALYWAARKKNEHKIIILYSLVKPYLKAVLAVKKKYPETVICCIVLDLPEFFNDKTSWLNTIISKRDTRYIYNELIPNIDLYVVLTKYMVKALNIKNKPWLLMEGIYSPIERKSILKEDYTILYTGLLDKRYGIAELIDAFMMIKDEKFRLWICGDGNDRYLIEAAVDKDKRIVYYGYQKQEKVFEMQQQATVLINPRQPNEEFTKYSFPSKTMEYMASGTPTLMYQLPGIPEEYFNYLVIIPDNSMTTLKDVIMKWCYKSKEELTSFGAKAKIFIETYKNAQIQSKRLIDFVTNKNIKK